MHNRGTSFSRQITETVTGRQLAQIHNAAGGNLIIYQPPSATIVRITSLVVVNVHASNTAVYKLYHSEISTTPGIANQIAAGTLLINANPDVYNLPLWMRSMNGGILLNSSAGEITVTVYGEEITL